MREPVRITAKDNQAVRQYKHLRDQKKVRRTKGMFVAEGLRIVQDALRYPDRLRTLFLTDTAWKKYGEALAVPENIKILCIPDAVGKTMADTEHTQGIFAICAMQDRPLSQLPEKGRFLGLCQLQDPGNMGMILRTADALGVDAVIGCGCCELYNPKVIRATMGSVYRVPFFETEENELFSALKRRKILSYAAVPSRQAVPLPECCFESSCAVWIGNEGNGLPEDVIRICDKAVTIPMQGGPESLNAAMAAGIFMWEMIKSGG